MHLLWLKNWPSLKTLQKAVEVREYIFNPTSTSTTAPCVLILLSATSIRFKSICWWMLIPLNTSPFLPLNTTMSLKVLGRSTTYQRWDGVLQRDRAVTSWPTLSMSTDPSSPSPKAGLRRAPMTCWWQCTALWRHSGESILPSLLWKQIILKAWQIPKKRVKNWSPGTCTPPHSLPTYLSQTGYFIYQKMKGDNFQYYETRSFPPMSDIFYRVHTIF